LQRRGAGQREEFQNIASFADVRGAACIQDSIQQVNQKFGWPCEYDNGFVSANLQG
jgi:hypothetical protein